MILLVARGVLRVISLNHIHNSWMESRGQGDIILLIYCPGTHRPSDSTSLPPQRGSECAINVHELFPSQTKNLDFRRKWDKDEYEKLAEKRLTEEREKKDGEFCAGLAPKPLECGRGRAVRSQIPKGKSWLAPSLSPLFATGDIFLTKEITEHLSRVLERLWGTSAY